MSRKSKAEKAPIYREIESLYVWLSSFTTRIPKTSSWEVLCVQIHSDVFHALRIAEACLNNKDSAKKLEYMGLIADDMNEVKAIFRLWCRLSEARLPRVVTPNQEAEFYERIMKIDNNLHNWRRSYS